MKGWWMNSNEDELIWIFMKGFYEIEGIRRDYMKGNMKSRRVTKGNEWLWRVIMKSLDEGENSNDSEGNVNKNEWKRIKTKGCEWKRRDHE